MGIDTESARFLLSSKASGASFYSCATLGRQNYFLANSETIRLLKEFGLNPNQYPDLLSGIPPRFSEPFWRLLGARELVTIDASNFEGATRVHDLNQPIPGELEDRFDAVCDVGTVEHVFDFPTAIRNAMRMVKPGGHLFLHTTGNNFFGHGFYQFSPELFYRILSVANGFHIERMVAVEYGPRRRWFEVADPERVRARVSLVNSFPVLLFVRAKKTVSVPLLMQTPQQSDYLAQWDSTKTASTGPERGKGMLLLGRRALETAPGIIRFFEALGFSALNPRYSFRNRRSFSRVRPKR